MSPTGYDKPSTVAQLDQNLFVEIGGRWPFFIVNPDSVVIGDRGFPMNAQEQQDKSDFQPIEL